MNKEFASTYLYIKRHKVTGLLYFGKTAGTEQYLLEEYNGSGKYWNRHINKHSTKVETIWYCLFTNKNDLVEFAMHCSKQWDIVNAVDSTGKKLWANEKNENGLDGNPSGFKHSESAKQKMSAAKKGKVASTETKKKMSDAKKGRPARNKGVPHTVESRQKISIAVTGENNPMFGKTHSIEAKQKISVARLGKSPANKGVPRTKEQKLAQSQSMKGRPAHNKGISAKLATCKFCGQTSTVGAIGRYHKDCGK